MARREESEIAREGREEGQATAQAELYPVARKLALDLVDIIELLLNSTQPVFDRDGTRLGDFIPDTEWVIIAKCLQAVKQEIQEATGG